MRWIVPILLLLASSAWSFDTNIWPLSARPLVNTYTNVIANDLVSNVVQRVRVTSDTNWNSIVIVPCWYETTNDYVTTAFTNGGVITSRTYTNAYQVTTNIAVTNYYGPFVQDVFTGAVPVQASSLEPITRKLETLLVRFSLPFYAPTNDFNFNAWYQKQHIVGATTNYPDDFPLASKVEAFHKIPLGGLLGITNGVTNLTFAAHLAYETNQWGQVTNGVGFWTKRKDRVNPLIVAQWGPESPTMPPEQMVYWGYDITNRFFGWWHDYLYGYAKNVNTYPPFPDMTDLEGNHLGFAAPPNEYCLKPYPWYGADPSWAYSRLIDLPETNYPTFIWIAGGTNGFTPFTLEFPPGNDGIYIPAGAYVSNNLLACPPDDFPAQVISSPTTRADRAWIALRGNLTGTPLNFFVTVVTNIEAGVTNITSTTNGGDHVQLVWTNKLTTYEGTKVWDNVLLPEQLDEHYVLMTNLFLTPWPISAWTNGAGYLSTNVTTFTNTLVTNATAYGSVTQSCPVAASAGLPWYRNTTIEPRPNYPSWMSNDWVFCTANLTIPPYTNGLSSPPSHSFNTMLDIDLYEYIRYEAKFNPPLTNGHEPYTNSTVWNWEAERADEATLSSIEMSVVSAPVLMDLWTGAEHRVHFYTRINPVTNTPPYYQRSSITAWSYASNIVGDVIDIRTEMTNSVHMTTNSTGSGCWDYYDAILWDPFYVTTTNLYTTAHTYIPTNVWYTNSISITTNYFSCGDTNIVVTDAEGEDDSNPDSWGVYGYAPFGIYLGDNANGWHWGWNGIEYIVWTPDLQSGYNIGATIPADSYAHGPDPATGTIHVAYSSLPVEYTNICTNISYGVSNINITGPTIGATNAVAIWGWQGFRYATTNDEPFYSVGDHVPLDLYVTNFSLTVTNYPELPESGVVVPETNMYRVTTASLGCETVTTRVESGYSASWAASNDYSVGQAPYTDPWPQNGVVDCIQSNEHWETTTQPATHLVMVSDPVVPIWSSSTVFAMPASFEPYQGYFGIVTWGFHYFWPILYRGSWQWAEFFGGTYNQYGMGSYTNGVGLPDVWPDTLDNWDCPLPLVSATGTGVPPVLSNGTWQVNYRIATLGTDFTLHEPCPMLEQVIGAQSGWSNRQQANTNIVKSVGVDVKAIVEWRFP